MQQLWSGVNKTWIKLDPGFSFQKWQLNRALFHTDHIDGCSVLQFSVLFPYYAKSYHLYYRTRFASLKNCQAQQA